MLQVDRRSPIAFRPLGDAGLLIEFAEGVDRGVSAAVASLDRRLAAAAPAGLLETVPAFRTLAVFFDPLATDHAAMEAAARAALADGDAAATAEPAKLWRFPVCYEPDCAPDLPEVAALAGLAPDAVVALHLAVTHHVYMLGFLPGAPYLGDLPKAIDLPRRASPRLAVPERSVAIAVGMTVIYPAESPGGWRLIGKTPARLFDADRATPALLAPGDAIRFEAIDGAELRRLEADRGWSPTWEPRADG